MTEFDEIYREYFKDVFLFVKGLSKDEDLTEKITTETFFKALKALDSFRGTCDIRSWLFQIAKNSYYSFLKKNKRLEFTSEWERIPETGSETKSPENLLLDKETSLRVHKQLHELEDPYKEVFSLRVFGELSFKQIGSIFEKTENWACVTFHRAKSKIQKGLSSDET